MSKKDYQNSFPIPQNEAQRLASVLSYDILDTEEEEELNKLTELAANLFEMPISLITIIDKKRQWFKSHYGIDNTETDREISFCQYTIMDNQIFEIEDATEDDRFKNNPFVLEGLKIRFYAGTPLINEDGFNMGSLCVVDQKPRKLTDNQKEALRLLGRQVVMFLELHRKKKILEKDKKELEKTIEKRTKSLNDVNNELRKFIYKTSHVLQGPVKTMMGLTSLALQDVKEENIRYLLSLLSTTEQKMDVTLSDLLKVVTIKEHENIKAKVNFKKLCHKALARTKETSKKDIEFVLEDHTTRPLVSDPILLELMLEQFFNNSVHFNIQPIPYIKVSIKETKNDFILEITDNGIGIPEEDNVALFDMFFKSEHSKGSGLGLYIVKNVIDLLEGNIEFSSVRNKGTTFKLNIPI
jgi:signal transduction histidine kinase